MSDSSILFDCYFFILFRFYTNFLYAACLLSTKVLLMWKLKKDIDNVINI